MKQAINQWMLNSDQLTRNHQNQSIPKPNYNIILDMKYKNWKSCFKIIRQYFS